jgi:hypothetical protein
MIRLSTDHFLDALNLSLLFSYSVSCRFPNLFPIFTRRKRFGFPFRFQKRQETRLRFLLLQKCSRKRRGFRPVSRVVFSFCSSDSPTHMKDGEIFRH